MFKDKRIFHFVLAKRTSYLKLTFKLFKICFLCVLPEISRSEYLRVHASLWGYIQGHGYRRKLGLMCSGGKMAEQWGFVVPRN